MRQSFLLSTFITLSTLFTFAQATAHHDRSLRHKKRFTKRAASGTANDGEWSYDACYVDPEDKRVLPGYKYESGSLSIGICQSTCQQKGFKYAGVEYGRECWCADSITAGSAKASDNDCSMPCASGSGKCGGGYRIGVYKYSSATTTPTTGKPAASWSYLACYNDPDNARVLPAYKTESDSLTPASCISTCEGKGYTFAGVEYGRECWCGSSLASGATKAGEDKCSMPCSGGSGQCGGGYAIGVFSSQTGSDPTPTDPSPTPDPSPTEPSVTWSYVACYNDPENARVLPGYRFESDSMTVGLCQSTCLGRGFSMAGVEYARECWCASSLAAGATKASEDLCSMTCAGGSGKCGGGYAIGVWTSSSTPTDPTPTDPEPTPDPTPTDPASGLWKYDACYNDPEGSRVLSAYSFTSNNGMTPELCTSTCKDRGFTLAGTEYGQECWCDNALMQGATKANENDCSMPCSGDSSLKCGNGYKISIYKLSTSEDPEPTPTPTPVTGKRSVGYFTNSGIYDRKFPPSLIPVNELTHILYAFAKVDESGGITVSDPWADEQIHYAGDTTWNDNWLYGNLNAIYQMKKQNRHLKVLMSVGGWNYSPQFHSVVLSATARAKFAQSAVKLLEDYGLDGIDVDYEYPGNDDEARGYAQLLAALRVALDNHAASKGTNHRFLITVAAPGGPYQYNLLHIPEMNESLDFWNLMAYDMAGPWDPVSGHQAAIYGGSVTVSVALQHYLDNGVPKDKMVIGIPLYGRAFENTDGPGKPYNGVGPGSWEEGIYDYRALPLPGAQIFRNEQNMASWSYDPVKREMVSFDDPVIAQLKAQWIVQQGLGGSMFWELSSDKGTTRQDFVGGPGKDDQPGASLVTTVVSAMGTLDRSENWISYGESKWENIRNDA